MAPKIFITLLMTSKLFRVLIITFFICLEAFFWSTTALIRSNF